MPRAPDGSFIGSTANSTLSEVVASSSRFSVGHKLSYRLSLSGWLGYDVAGGLTTDDQLRYPQIKGPSASLALTRRFTRATDGGVEALVRHFRDFDRRKNRTWLRWGCERTTTWRAPRHSSSARARP
ncbi:MAG: hypothetical protein QM756_37610 [Polyangiaceae bacterium]